MTGQELFEHALDLCGLRKADSTLPDDIDDLKQRALSLINITLAENASLDGRIRRTEHTVAKLITLGDVIDCCDVVAETVLPYGLARLMMLGEDDALAADLSRLYSNARAEALGFGKAKTEAISEVYS